MLLEGKNALITGAARGIGAAMVEVFAREGANVWAFARTPDARFEARLAMAAGKYGVWIKPVYCELTDTAATGDPTRATAEKGAKMEAALVDCVVSAIRQLDEMDWDYTSSAIHA